jgi:hypothetical protein
MGDPSKPQEVVGLESWFAAMRAKRTMDETPWKQV